MFFRILFGGSLVGRFTLSPSAEKLHTCVLGFAQSHKGAALDLRRDFVPFETHLGGSLGCWACSFQPSAEKLHAGYLGFAQTHKGAALDPRRDFVPFETHSNAP